MVTIEEEAIKLFEQGKKPEEVHKILIEMGIKASISTIKNYYRLRRRGFKSQYEYRKYLARKYGFKNYSESRKYLVGKNGLESWPKYQDGLAQKKEFKNYYEYCKYMIKDSNFRKIYYSNGSDGINENNPYILMSKIWKMKYILGEGITGTKEYEKLNEILKNIEPTKRLKYIEKLERGVEILIKLGKIDYGNVSVLYSV